MVIGRPSNNTPRTIMIAISCTPRPNMVNPPKVGSALPNGSIEGTFYFSFTGRPLGRMVESRSSRLAVRFCHFESPLSSH